MLLNKNKTLKNSSLLCQPWQPSPTLFGVLDQYLVSRYKSDTPTRHICVVHLKESTLRFKQLFVNLDRLGDIGNITPYVLSNMSIVSYYKMEDAKDAINFINKMYASSFKSYYAASCSQEQKLDDSFTLLITQKGDKQANYMEPLLNIGSIYSLSVTTISSKQKIISIEYDDCRVSIDLVSKLNNKTVNNTKYQVLLFKY